MRLHTIRTCLNYHTYSRLLIYPYGYLEAESEDSLIYREFAFDMTRTNRYATGTDQQTVNYSTRGNSDDYMYGDATKFRTFAMTPEVGTSFWPPSNQILPLAQENLPANIHYSYVAGAMPVLAGAALSGPGADSGFLPGASFSFQAAIRNKGLDTADGLTVSFSTDSGTLQFASGSIPVSGIAPMGDTLLGVAGTVDASSTPGSEGPSLRPHRRRRGYDRTDTVTIFIGSPSVLFSDDAESGTASWIAGGSWGVSAVAHDGALSFHDSPSGPSPVGSNAGIQTGAPINLAGYSAAKLEFWTKWAIEPAYDFGMVRISTNGGAAWSTLRPALSNTGSGSGVQLPGLYGFDAYTPRLDWVRQEIDISEFAGSAALLRFELDTDGADSRDGWYIDDIRITGYRETIPGSALASPRRRSPGAIFTSASGRARPADRLVARRDGTRSSAPARHVRRQVDIAGPGALIDVRDTLGSPTDTNIFTLRFRSGASDYPLVIRWDRDNLAPGAWTIMDTLPARGRRMPTCG